METSTKNLQASRALDSLLKTITTLSLSLAKRLPTDTLPCELLMCGIPYEATETYRNIRRDFETNKSLAVIEVRQALWRC